MIAPAGRVDERRALAAVPAPRVAERRVVPDRAPAPPPVASEPPPSPSPREIAGQFDVAFRAESTDATWASETRRGLETALASLIPRGSQVRSLECRASFCRVETMHQDRSTYRIFLERAIFDPSQHLGEGPTFSALLDERGDGQVVAVSYLARAGRELPRFE